MDKIELGDFVEDTVSTLQGVAVCRTQWLHGCTRVTMQPRHVDKDGKVAEQYTVDEPQLRLISKRGADIPVRKAPIDPLSGDPSFVPSQH